MRISVFIVAALALIALAACAPSAAPGTTPTAGSPAQSIPTSAPTQVIGPTSAAAQAPTAVASPSETSPTASTTVPATLTTEATLASTPEATTSATSDATGSATTAATSAVTAAATGAATLSATPNATGAAPNQIVTIQASEFKFEPNTISVKVGQRVRIVMVNAGKIDHELEIDTDAFKPDNVVLDLSKAGNIPEDEHDEAVGDATQNEVHAYTGAGGTATVDFTPTEAGTFDFACNITGHKEAGMAGTITVTP